MLYRLASRPATLLETREMSHLKLECEELVWQRNMRFDRGHTWPRASGSSYQWFIISVPSNGVPTLYVLDSRIGQVQFHFRRTGVYRLEQYP